MSWKSPIIIPNRKKPGVDQTHIPRAESAPDLAKLHESGNEVVEVNKNRFTCYLCGGGWDFCRMKTITCTGSDDTVVHKPVIYVQI